jgi:hypothetical protein
VNNIIQALTYILCACIMIVSVATLTVARDVQQNTLNQCVQLEWSSDQ